MAAYAPGVYLKFDEMEALMKAWAEQYPAIASLESIGTTHGSETTGPGKELWLLTLTDAATGAHDQRAWRATGGALHERGQELRRPGRVSACCALTGRRRCGWWLPLELCGGGHGLRRLDRLRHHHRSRRLVECAGVDSIEEPPGDGAVVGGGAIGRGRLVARRERCRGGHHRAHAERRGGHEPTRHARRDAGWSRRLGRHRVVHGAIGRALFPWPARCSRWR